MNEKDYPMELPRDVVSLSRSKPKQHRESWILVATRDEDFDIDVVEVDQDGSVMRCHGDTKVPYCDFWKILAIAAWSRVVNWTLCFRAKYLLHKACWLDALASGQIELERQRKLAGKQAGTGRMCLSQGITELDLRIGKRKIKLLDFANFAVSLDSYQIKTNQQNSDTIISIFEDWIAALGEVGLSAARTSAPQIGWAKLRESLGSYEIFTSLDPAIRALERRCYYGGRCEAYQLGEVNRPVYSVDVRGAYAAICRDTALPIIPARYWPEGFDASDDDITDGMDVAADCIVNVDAPLFPVRHHGKTIYPIGRFFTSLCGAEFDDAMGLGCVERVTRAVAYHVGPALTDYALWYMGARDTIKQFDDGRLSSSIKCAFNSSLGFLARQGREWQLWEPAGTPPWWFGITIDPDDPGAVVGAHTLNGDSEMLRIGSEPRNCAPIVHAAICAKMRERLASLMAYADQSNVFYVDTDGLLVNEAGYRRLTEERGVIGDGYGMVTVRYKAGRCTINGQKSYKIGDKVVCAGMTRDRHQKWSENAKHVTEIGHISATGKITPFVMSCEDIGDETAKWKNTIVSV